MKLTRAEFFGAIGAALCAMVAPKRKNDNERYPWSDAQIPSAHGNSFNLIKGRCTVTVDGEDVTSRCYYYDVYHGAVGLYKHRDGKPYYDPDTHGVAEEFRRGKVEVFVS